MASARTSDLHEPIRVVEPTVARASNGFAAVLRERTKDLHREAERTGFMSDLLRGRVARTGYGVFLRNLVPVYEALENALACVRDDPLTAPFGARAIRRLPRLVADASAIAGEHWARQRVLPEAEAYAVAIREAAADGSSRLVAHAYARYLGDLSGGQILRPLLARNLGLADTELSFYDFPDVGDVEKPKADMRQALDTIPAESDAGRAVIDEALSAFRHNIALSLAISRAS